ncbi:carbohydrate kinase [Propionibacterium freudenreichii]|uniref:carbohydrate kinase family protein n=1 Tax=Propionibacterium freudenreichii TaxID=1744 RepID=UPI000543225D|nr:carbohydrate kinase [Propionibacterium freudenreichii]MDK9645238.1 carbohydrate kinase [Propionibacterium freudenreichii]CEG87437.1 fructokinase [Propionibacterium freudenreichii]CEI28750.1 fructokinase [Propionibacterium freudenreichii]
MAVVVCGEALIDLIPDNSRAGTTQSSYWQAHSAGGPLNTAVALSRLGVPTRFLGRFGIDGFGAQLRSHLRANGVDDSLGVQTLAGSTSLSVVSVDSSGAARYVFHLRGTANFGWKPEEFPQLDADDWLHTGSLVATVEPGRSALLDFVRTTPAHLSYDLNVRPTVEPDPDAYLALIDPFVQVVSQRGGVVRASDEDLLWLAGGHGEIDDLARAAVERYGMDLLVVTLGAHGALATGVGRETVRVPGFPAAVVDTVGAGDTFTAGFLQGWLRDADLTAALLRGCAAASIVCTRVGADPPTAAEVDELLAAGPTRTDPPPDTA